MTESCHFLPVLYGENTITYIPSDLLLILPREHNYVVVLIRGALPVYVCVVKLEKKRFLFGWKKKKKKKKIYGFSHMCVNVMFAHTHTKTPLIIKFHKKIWRIWSEKSKTINMSIHAITSSDEELCGDPIETCNRANNLILKSKMNLLDPCIGWSESFLFRYIVCSMLNVQTFEENN